MTDRTCPSCAADISHRGPKAIYCSNACRRWRANGHLNIRVRKPCAFCRKPLDGKIITAEYCTRACKSKASEKRRVRDDAARYLNEREVRIARATAYSRANPHVAQATKRRRKALVAGAIVAHFTPRDWLRLQIRFDYRCAYCGIRAPLSMDHVVPIVRGGTHSVGNILPACTSCNCHKQARFITEWRYGKSRRLIA